MIQSDLDSSVGTNPFMVEMADSTPEKTIKSIEKRLKISKSVWVNPKMKQYGEETPLTVVPHKPVNHSAKGISGLSKKEVTKALSRNI